MKMKNINKITKENYIQTFFSKKNFAILYLRFFDTYIKLKINEVQQLIKNICTISFYYFVLFHTISKSRTVTF